MIKKFLYKLSKKASRKNLDKNIIKSFKKIDSSANVLNIGSGGDIQVLINKHYKTTHSIDIDKNRNPDQILDICDEDFLTKLEFDANLICCFEVLEHTIDPRKAIRNIYETLNDGDYFLASVPFNFHIHDAPNDFYRFTFYGLKLLLKDFSEVKIINRNGWLESIFVNLIRMEKENNILSKILGKTFLLLYFITLPLILFLQKIMPSDKLTTGYFIEAKK
jgi:SAM-dependent methyltransferase